MFLLSIRYCGKIGDMAKHEWILVVGLEWVKRKKEDKQIQERVKIGIGHIQIPDHGWQTNQCRRDETDPEPAEWRKWKNRVKSSRSKKG